MEPAPRAHASQAQEAAKRAEIESFRAIRTRCTRSCPHAIGADADALTSLENTFSMLKVALASAERRPRVSGIIVLRLPQLYPDEALQVEVETLKVRTYLMTSLFVSSLR